jgi:hypothetical protein
MPDRLVRLIASLAPATAPSGEGAGWLRPGPAAAHEWKPCQACGLGRVASTWTVVGDRRPVGLAEACGPVRHPRRSRDAAPIPVRLLGLDLGVTSEHAAVVLDATGSVCARRRARPTVDSLAALEAAALAGAEPAPQLVVVIEPTGPAWPPIAVFFGRPGAYRAAGQLGQGRRPAPVPCRHANSNGIDAETPARLPLVAPGGWPRWSSPATRGRRWTVGCGQWHGLPPRSAGARPGSALAQALIPTIPTALSDDGLKPDRPGHPGTLR